MHERWRPVVGWEEFYEVSDLGRVRSLDRMVNTRGNGYRIIPGRVMAQSRSKKGEGYFRVNLWVKGRPVANRTVHSLMAEAFLGARPAGHVVCHRDDDPTHNVLANIRYDTHAANIADRDAISGHPSALKTHCPYGHEYDERNTILTVVEGKRHRRCRACRVAYRSTEHYKAKRRKGYQP